MAATAQWGFARRSVVALKKKEGEDRRAQESAAARRERATALLTIHAWTATLAGLAAQVRENGCMEHMSPF